MFQAILKIVIEALNAASGDISLLNPETGKLEIEIANEGNGTSHEDLSLRLGQGITGWVAFHGRPQLVADVSKDPRYVRVRHHVRTEMVTPMIGSNGHVMGVINIDGDHVDSFNDTDLELQLALTTAATSVMERHWELKNLHGKERQLQTLISIDQTLVTKLEPQELFESITNDARNITASQACALYLHEPETTSARLVAYAGPDLDHRPSNSLPLDSCLVASAIHTRRAV